MTPTSAAIDDFEEVEEFSDDEDDGDKQIMTGDRPPPAQPQLVQKYLSSEHFSAAQQYRETKHALIRELQQFDHDTGTMPVQVGLLTQRIQYLTRHTQTHRKDHASRRGLHILLSRRRKQLKYLRKKDFDGYVKVLRRFNLKDNYYETGWGEPRVRKAKKKDSPRVLAKLAARAVRTRSVLKWRPDDSDNASLPPVAQVRAQVAAEIAKSLEAPVRVDGKTRTRKELQTHAWSTAVFDERRAHIRAAAAPRDSAEGSKSGIEAARAEIAATRLARRWAMLEQRWRDRETARAAGRRLRRPTPMLVDGEPAWLEEAERETLLREARGVRSKDLPFHVKQPRVDVGPLQRQT